MVVQSILMVVLLRTFQNHLVNSEYFSEPKRQRMKEDGHPHTIKFSTDGISASLSTSTSMSYSNHTETCSRYTKVPHPIIVC